jgi:hypothetical protein
MKGKPPSLARFAEIVANMRPLMEFYRANKPQVSSLRLFAQDYKTIRDWPKKAAAFGFMFHGEQIKYQEFTLLSDTENV